MSDGATFLKSWFVCPIICGISVLLLWAQGCHQNSPANSSASIEITHVPEASSGGPQSMDFIAGSVKGNKPGQRVVIYARSVVSWMHSFTVHRFQNFTRDDGLSSNTVEDIAEGRDGAVWLATPNGLDEHRADKWKTFLTSHGLPSSDMRTISEDTMGVLWIGTSEGLAYLQAGQLHIPANLPESLREPIFGLAQDMRGSLWFVTSDHVLQVNRDDLLAGQFQEGDVRSYGIDDGLPGIEGVDRNRSMVSNDGQPIWLSLHGGLAMTDSQLSFQDAEPANVRLEGILAGNRRLPDTQPLRVPPGKRLLEENSTHETLIARFVFDAAFHPGALS